MPGGSSRDQRWVKHEVWSRNPEIKGREPFQSLLRRYFTILIQLNSWTTFTLRWKETPDPLNIPPQPRIPVDPARNDPAGPVSEGPLWIVDKRASQDFLKVFTKSTPKLLAKRRPERGDRRFCQLPVINRRREHAIHETGSNESRPTIRLRQRGHRPNDLPQPDIATALAK